MDRFNDITTKILKDFYKHFPAPHYTTPESVGLTQEVPEYVDGENKTSDQYQSFSNEIRGALLWMIEEGLVSDRGYKFGPSHVLTSDGLKVLNRIDPEYEIPLISRQ